MQDCALCHLIMLSIKRRQCLNKVFYGVFSLPLWATFLKVILMKLLYSLCRARVPLTDDCSVIDQNQNREKLVHYLLPSSSWASNWPLAFKKSSWNLLLMELTQQWLNGWGGNVYNFCSISGDWSVLRGWNNCWSSPDSGLVSLRLTLTLLRTADTDTLTLIIVTNLSQPIHTPRSNI